MLSLLLGMALFIIKLGIEFIGVVFGAIILTISIIIIVNIIDKCVALFDKLFEE